MLNHDGFFNVILFKICLEIVLDNSYIVVYDSDFSASHGSLDILSDGASGKAETSPLPPQDRVLGTESRESHGKYDLNVS